MEFALLDHIYPSNDHPQFDRSVPNIPTDIWTVHQTGSVQVSVFPSQTEDGFPFIPLSASLSVFKNIMLTPNRGGKKVSTILYVPFRQINYFFIERC